LTKQNISRLAQLFMTCTLKLSFAGLQQQCWCWLIAIVHLKLRSKSTKVVDSSHADCIFRIWFDPLTELQAMVHLL